MITIIIVLITKKRIKIKNDNDMKVIKEMMNIASLWDAEVCKFRQAIKFFLLFNMEWNPASNQTIKAEVFALHFLLSSLTQLAFCPLHFSIWHYHHDWYSQKSHQHHPRISFPIIRWRDVLPKSKPFTSTLSSRFEYYNHIAIANPIFDLTNIHHHHQIMQIVDTTYLGGFSKC